MASLRQPGSQCQYDSPLTVEDGTLARLESSIAGTLCGLSNSARRYVRSIGNVKDAFLLGIKKYALSETIAKLGDDATALIAGVWPGFVQGLEIYVIGIGAGALVGGIVGGVLGEGIGAAPGAILGAEIGADAATGVLWFLGIKFLAEYVLGHLGEATGHFKKACTLAWDAPGDPPRIDPAAREFGRAIASLFSLVVEATVAFVLAKGLKAGLEKLKESKTGRALAPYAEVQYWRRKIGVTDAPIPRQGIANTLEFFEEQKAQIRARNRNEPLSEDLQTSYMKAMDFSKEVRVEPLKAGDEVVAFHDPAFGESKHFFTKSGSSMDRLGIAESTSASGPGRVFDRYRLTKNVEVLRSYCSGVKDHNTGALASGGAVQYFFANPAGILERVVPKK